MQRAERGQITAQPSVEPPLLPSANATQQPVTPPAPQSPIATQQPVVPPTTPLPSSLSEVLPSSKQLSDSMRVIPTGLMPDLNKRMERAEVNNQKTQCINVGLRPDPARQSVSLVDFGGDGLIVSAVPSSHIQSVFAQAGYAPIDASRAASWCIPQTTARALLLPAPGATTQAAAWLVQTGRGLQLMSQDQWLAHQAAKTMTAQPRGASKAVKKLASKRSKALNQLATSASNLPPM